MGLSFASLFFFFFLLLLLNASHPFSLRLPPSASSSHCRRTYCFPAWRSLGLCEREGRRQIGFKSFFRSPQEAGKEAHDFPPATEEEVTDDCSGAADSLIACGGSVVTHGGRLGGRGGNDHKLFAFVIIKC